MSWTEIKAGHTELGETMTVAQPAVILELYAEYAQLAQHGTALLDRFLAAMPTGMEFYVLDFGRGNGRQYKRLTSAALRRVRASLDKHGGK